MSVQHEVACEERNASFCTFTKAGGPGSLLYRCDHAFDLPHMRPFMDNQPLRIGLHGRFEDLPHCGNLRRAFPRIDWQKGEGRQEIGTLCRKGVQREAEIQFRIVRLLNPCAGTDCLPRWPILGDNFHNASAPDVCTRTQMSQHLIGRPLIEGRFYLQYFWGEIMEA